MLVRRTMGIIFTSVLYDKVVNTVWETDLVYRGTQTWNGSRYHLRRSPGEPDPV